MGVDDAYNNLANAIVLFTIKDYLKGRITASQFERYMRSDWFQFLVDIEPETMIEATYKIQWNGSRKKNFFKVIKEIEK